MKLIYFTTLACMLSPAVLAANWAVSVGANNLFAFSPNEIHPAAGDTVTFTFMTRNHSATTTTFTNPCPPPPGGVGPGAFDTGFHPTTAGAAFPTAVVTIRDTQPHWVSCMQAAGAHCRMGMTLSINPPNGNTGMTETQFMTNAQND